MEKKAAKEKKTGKKQSLLIVESPAKAKAIGKYLGNKFIVKASLGHVKDLPESKLGIDVENHFNPEYVTIKGKGTFLKEVKKLSKEVDGVYLGPDPDREGEVIAWHIANEIKDNNQNIYRVLLNEITPEAVKYATKHPTTLNVDKINAQQARRVLDRLVGYQISPLLWHKIKMGLSAGRVQSVAVRLVCDREDAIAAFVSEEYWSITALLASGKETFEAKLAKYNGEDLKIHNEQESNTILANLANAEYIVKNIEKKEKKRNPVAPFITSKLQQEAARKLRFSSKKTMMVAQQLYEGVDVGNEGPMGLITYMRTDSTRLSADSVTQAREIIRDLYGAEYVPENPVFYKNKKGAQDAHEAIRPTYPGRKPEDVREYLSGDQYELYKLIWNRFIACQVKPAVFDVVSIDISAGDYTFRATGSTVKFDGFMRVYTEGTDMPAKDRQDEESSVLPPMSQNDRLLCREITPGQHFTQPPPRFNEPLLIKVLEEEGIGRPSTYASIISTIQSREYVRVEEGRFRPTELGTMVNTMLVKFFPDILNIHFTAQMEEKLDLIEEGESNWISVLENFYGGFRQTLDKAKIEMKDLKKEEIPTDIKCPKCDNIMLIKWGKNGRFLGCSKYPECKNTMEFETADNGEIKVVEKEAPTNETCDVCGKPMVMKTGRFGKFLACSGYPECKQTKGSSTGVPCPNEGCTGKITEKKTKRGKTFFSCSQYPKCTYALWDKPVAKPCPACNFPLMVEKAGKLCCTQQECGYKS